ncbi:nucleoside hydrolase [Streptomyces sp. NPDC056716]|uniref:nucleoside hydrolase n=1 Tax=unclassified Streptomyces TaxID=2593676 RepID=UPI0036C4CCF5
MRIIIDCDPGNRVPGANVDDGLALGLAAASQDLALELVTTVAGNTPVDIGYQVARSLLDDWGMSIPVRKGAARPLRQDPGPWRKRLDRRRDPLAMDLWTDVAPPRQYAPAEPTADVAIAELVSANPGEITIVAIGPLTNIARAMHLNPGLARDVAEIVIMGGVFGVEGYTTDTNFGYDPEAAATVLGSGARITLVPMDATVQTLMTHGDLDAIGAIGSPLTRSLVSSTRPWVTFSSRTRGIPGAWLHDVLTVALLIDRTVATGVTETVGVELTDPTFRGRTRLRPSPAAGGAPGTPADGSPMTVLKTVDNDKLLRIVFEAFVSQAAALSARTGE